MALSLAYLTYICILNFVHEVESQTPLPSLFILFDSYVCPGFSGGCLYFYLVLLEFLCSMK